MKPYWKYQGELSVHDNLLLYQNRLVIPKQQQQQVLEKLHTVQGIQRCRLRAKSLVWWFIFVVTLTVSYNVVVPKIFSAT